MNQKRRSFSPPPFAILIAYAAVVALVGEHIPFLAHPATGDQARANAVGLLLGGVGFLSFWSGFTNHALSEASTAAQARKNGLVGGTAALASGALLICLGEVRPGGSMPQIPASVVTVGVGILLVLSESYLRRHRTAAWQQRVDRASLQMSRIGFPLLLVWGGLAQAGAPVGFSALNVLTGVFLLSYIVSIIECMQGAKR